MSGYELFLFVGHSTIEVVLRCFHVQENLNCVDGYYWNLLIDVYYY